MNQVIRPIAHADWPRLEYLWVALYEHQKANGMLITLPPNAFWLWVESIRPLVERFSFVLVSEERDDLIGFLAGRIRSLPAHFGGQQIGYISEIFVADTHRGRGIAGELLSAGIHWFQQREIHRVELSVLPKNYEAREFYLHRGWVEDLVQIVWQDDAPGIRDKT